MNTLEEDVMLGADALNREFGIPASLLKELAGDGVVRSESRFSSDGREWRVFSRADVTEYLRPEGGR